MKKNVASQIIGGQMITASDGTLFSGTVTAYFTGDGGTQTIGSVGSGVCTHEGRGFHTYTPTQGETNFDHIGWTFTGTGAIPATVQVYTTFPQAGDSFGLIGTAGVGLSNIPLPATGLDLVLKSSTFALAMADAIWDEVLTGATHNVATSSGKRLRQVEASFVVTSGTAQAGGSNTITLASGESATTNIFRGDRIIIVAGTGVGEHGIVTAYDGSTKIATMAESWVITPDNTSEYDLTPATIDVETWQHTVVTGLGDLAQVEADTAAILVETGDIQGATFDTATDSLEALRDQGDAFVINDLIADASPTAGSFKGSTSLNSTNGWYTNSLLVFTSGVLAGGPPREITNYIGATRLLIFDRSFPDTPADTNTFKILGLIKQ